MVLPSDADVQDLQPQLLLANMAVCVGGFVLPGASG